MIDTAAAAAGPSSLPPSPPPPSLNNPPKLEKHKQNTPWLKIHLLHSSHRSLLLPSWCDFDKKIKEKKAQRYRFRLKKKKAIIYWTSKQNLEEHICIYTRTHTYTWRVDERLQRGVVAGTARLSAIGKSSSAKLEFRVFSYNNNEPQTLITLNPNPNAFFQIPFCLCICAGLRSKNSTRDWTLDFEVLFQTWSLDF